MEESPRERLAAHIKARRLALRLSTRAAAEAARIDRATWTTAEAGSRDLREYNYTGIERALSWEPGTIDKLLAGEIDQPIVATRAVAGTAHANLPALDARMRGQVLAQDDALIESIWASPLPDEDKIELVRIVLDERADADRRAADRFAERLRWHNRQAQ